MSFWPSCLVAGELMLWILAAFLHLRRRGLGFAESAAAAILGTLMAISCWLQAVFLLERPELAPAGELGLGALSLVGIWRHRCELAPAWRQATAFLARHRLAAAWLLASWAYLAALAWLLPPDSGDGFRYHLSRVLLFAQERTLFLELNELHQAPRVVFPVGSDILSHLWLRFGSDYGVALIGFLAYLAVGFGTWALARRYAGERATLVATVVVLSFPALVYQASSVKNDLLMAAVGLLCLLLADRLLERLDAAELVLLGLALLFGVAVKLLFLGFALPFAAVYGFLLLRRHSWRHVTGCLIARRSLLAGAVVPAFVLSQVWLFAHHQAVWGHPFGPPEFLASSRNHDGLWGAVANLVRYAFELPDSTKVVDRLAAHLAGQPLSKMLESAYSAVFDPIFRGVGTSSTFTVDWSTHESKAWFGPLAALLVLPATLRALLRGPLGLRAQALTLVAFAGVVTYQVEWMQWNGRLFSLFFAATGPFVAAFLDGRAPARKLVAAAAGLLLIYGLGFNEAKPLFPLVAKPETFVQKLLHDNIWVRSDWGQKRWVHFPRPEWLEDYAARVPEAGRVGILSADAEPFYHFLIRRPDVRAVPLPRRMLADGKLDAAAFDLVLCLGLESCDRIFYSPAGR